MKPSLIVVGLWLIASSALAQQNLPPEVSSYADLILHNGTVLTMDRDHPKFTVAEAVAIRGKDIMAVGPNSRVLQMAGPNTRKIDLQGGTLTPGFFDTHVHPDGSAKNHFQGDFRDQLAKLDLYKVAHISMMEWNDRQAALAKLKKTVDTAKPGQWVITSVGHEIEPGSAKHAKALKADFDRIAPNNPVALIETTTHAVVNSKALALLLPRYQGIRSVANGVWQDEAGQPTGYLYGAARGALDEILPRPPSDLFITAFKKELEEWVSTGVTTISTRLNSYDLTTYAHLDRLGEMPMRIGYSHGIGWWNPTPARDLVRIGGLQNHGSEMLWMTGITPSPPDDAPDSEGGVCSAAPKLRSIVTDAVAKPIPLGDLKPVITKDLYPEGPGLCRWRLPGGEVSEEAILEANRLGYRITGTHTFGDLSIKDMLDVFEKANKDRPVKGRRFAIDHTMMVSPEVIKQAAPLGIIWSVQPQMMEGQRSDLTAMTYGEPIANRWLQPVNSIMAAGMMVTYGGGTHGDPSGPMTGMQFLVTRQNHRGVVYGAEQAVDRVTALLMMTRWGAYYVERENQLGTIEPGKRADLVLLDKNPLDTKQVPDDKLSGVRILMTLVNGQLKYTAKNFASSAGLPLIGYQGTTPRDDLPVSLQHR